MTPFYENYGITYYTETVYPARGKNYAGDSACNISRDMTVPICCCVMTERGRTMLTLFNTPVKTLLSLLNLSQWIES